MSETSQAHDDDARVPKHRLDALNDKLKAAEQRAGEYESKFGELQSELEALRDKDRPEIERLAKTVEKLQAERDQARAEADQTRTEAARASKRTLISETAAKLNFQNPGDASLFVDIDEIEDATAAERALKQVAKDRGYLIKPDTPDPRGLNRVLTAAGQDQNAAPVTGETRVQRPATQDEVAKIAESSEMWRVVQEARAREGRPPLPERV